MAEVQERRKKTVEASMTEQVHLIMQQHLKEAEGFLAER